MVFSGNTSTSASSVVFETAALLKSFSITNKSGSAVTVNVSVLYGSTNTWISPFNLSLAAGEMLEDSKGIILLAGRLIYIQVSGSCDYYFNIE